MKALVTFAAAALLSTAALGQNEMEVHVPAARRHQGRPVDLANGKPIDLIVRDPRRRSTSHRPDGRRTYSTAKETPLTGCPRPTALAPGGRTAGPETGASCPGGTDRPGGSPCSLALGSSGHPRFGADSGSPLVREGLAASPGSPAVAEAAAAATAAPWASCPLQRPGV